MILVGGATGTGKSTVATEIAYRLGITRVTSTDFIRQTMRAFFSHEFMPSIHYSSFEAAIAVPDADDPLVAGFLEQSRQVLVGVRASIERALQEGWSMVLEGVHLVPGLLPPSSRAPSSARASSRSRTRRPTRSTSSTREAGERAADGEVPRPLRRDPAPAALHRRPRASARASPVIENESADRATGAVAELVLSAAERGAGARVTQTEPSSTPSRRRSTLAPCLCQSYLRATEHAALRAARWLGRADQEAAEEAAAAGMRASLDILPDPRPRRLRLARDEGGLDAGSDRRRAAGAEVDLALDPLEGRGVVARGGNGAMSMIARRRARARS